MQNYGYKVKRANADMSSENRIDNGRRMFKGFK